MYRGQTMMIYANVNKTYFQIASKLQETLVPPKPIIM